MKEPRRNGKGHHPYPLEEILFLCISAVASGMGDWTSITMFGRLKLPWLQQYLTYKRGIPSHDVLGKPSLEPGCAVREDSSLKKKGNSALNYNIIIKMALNILERETES